MLFRICTIVFFFSNDIFFTWKCCIMPVFHDIIYTITLSRFSYKLLSNENGLKYSFLSLIKVFCNHWTYHHYSPGYCLFLLLSNGRTYHRPTPPSSRLYYTPSPYLDRHNALSPEVIKNSNPVGIERKGRQYSKSKFYVGCTVWLLRSSVWRYLQRFSFSCNPLVLCRLINFRHLTGKSYKENVVAY